MTPRGIRSLPDPVLSPGLYTPKFVSCGIFLGKLSINLSPVVGSTLFCRTTVGTELGLNETRHLYRRTGSRSYTGVYGKPSYFRPSPNRQSSRSIGTMNDPSFRQPSKEAQGKWRDPRQPPKKTRKRKLRFSRNTYCLLPSSEWTRVLLLRK